MTPVQQFAAALNAQDVEQVRTLLEAHAEVRTAINAPIGHFDGRVYRLEPSNDHYDSWHDDLGPARSKIRDTQEDGRGQATDGGVTFTEHRGPALTAEGARVGRHREH